MLLDVYGEDCGPCRRLAPVIERLAGEYEGRARVLKVRTKRIGQQAGVSGISSAPVFQQPSFEYLKCSIDDTGLKMSETPITSLSNRISALGIRKSSR